MDKARKAKFSHAVAGVLYYKVESNDGKLYEFSVDMNDADDVGTTTFDSEIKAVTMMRYIRKCIKNESLIDITSI